MTEIISTNDVFKKFLSKIEMEENFFNQINDINFKKKMFATNIVEGERLNTFPFKLLQRQRWIFFQLLSIAKS